MRRRYGGPARVAARISRLAIGQFVLLYAAGEAVQGIAVGLLVEHANGAPVADRPR